MDEQLCYILVGGLVMGLIGCLIGNTKGIGGWGFLLGLFLGPLGILLVCFLNGSRTQCPYCRSTIDGKASVCAHCQRDIHQPPSSLAPVAALPSEESTHECPFCHHAIVLTGEGASSCPSCQLQVFMLQGQVMTGAQYRSRTGRQL